MSTSNNDDSCYIYTFNNKYGITVIHILQEVPLFITDPNVLSIQVFYRREIILRYEDDYNRRMQFAAYCQFILWLHGLSGIWRSSDHPILLCDSYQETVPLLHRTIYRLCARPIELKPALLWSQEFVLCWCCTRCNRGRNLTWIPFFQNSWPSNGQIIRYTPDKYIPLKFFNVFVWFCNLLRFYGPSVSLFGPQFSVSKI